MYNCIQKAILYIHNRPSRSNHSNSSRGHRPQTSKQWSIGTMQTIREKAKDEIKEASTQLGHTQEKLLKQITKNALLSIVAIISTFLFLLIRIMTLLIVKDDTIILIYSILGALDSTMDLLAIYLNFAFAENYYQKLCSSCHNCCSSQCRKIAHRKIYRSNKKKYLKWNFTENNKNNTDNYYQAMT